MTRPAWQITLAAWHALLLREAVARMFSRRIALVWLLLEPVAHIGFTVMVYAVIRARVVGGMDLALWTASGLLAFFLFRRVATQGAAAIGANRALFTYRQVRPVDTVLMRCVLEGLLMCMIAGVVIGTIALLDVRVSADAPLQVILSILGLWLLALGWALLVSVANELLPELSGIADLLMTPMMLVSGVIFPLSAVPHGWRQWLLLNPVAHGIEGVRAGLSDYYHHAPELDLQVLFGAALLLVFLGLALHVRLRNHLLAL